MEDLNLCVGYAEQLIERARARHQFSDAPIMPIAAGVPRLVRISRGGGESLAETRCPNAIQTKSARRKQHFTENVRGFNETNIHCRHSNGRAAGATYRNREGLLLRYRRASPTCFQGFLCPRER